MLNELPEIRLKSGRIIQIPGGKRDVKFPNDPDIPEAYRGCIVNVIIQPHRFLGPRVYRTDTREELTGKLRDYVLDYIHRYPV